MVTQGRLVEAAQHDRRLARLIQCIGQARTHAAGQPRKGIGHPGIGRADPRFQLGPDFGPDRAAESGLVGKVVEEAALRHPRPANDLVDCQGVDRALRQQFQPGIDQRAIGPLGAGIGGNSSHGRNLLDQMVTCQ